MIPFAKVKKKKKKKKKRKEKEKKKEKRKKKRKKKRKQKKTARLQSLAPSTPTQQADLAARDLRLIVFTRKHRKPRLDPETAYRII